MQRAVFEQCIHKVRLDLQQVAFANGAGGTVLIGVEDQSRHVIGVPNPTRAEEQLAAVADPGVVSSGDCIGIYSDFEGCVCAEGDILRGSSVRYMLPGNGGYGYCSCRTLHGDDQSFSSIDTDKRPW